MLLSLALLRLPPLPARPSLLCLARHVNASRTRCCEQVDDKAAYKFFANCRQAANRVWNEDSDTSLAEEVKAAPGPSQSVLNGLHQCVIAITRSSQRPQQDELYFMALRRIFFLPCFSPPAWIYIIFSLLPLRDKAGSECRIVFCLWTTSQSFHLLCFLKGTFSAYLKVKWLPARLCISMNFHASANYISDLVWLILCCKQTRICARCTTNMPLMYSKMKKRAVSMFLDARSP